MKRHRTLVRAEHIPSEKALAELQSDAQRGLHMSEAAKRIALYGKNELPPKESTCHLRRHAVSPFSNICFQRIPSGRWSWNNFGTLWFASFSELLRSLFSWRVWKVAAEMKARKYQPMRCLTLFSY